MVNKIRPSSDFYAEKAALNLAKQLSQKEQSSLDQRIQDAVAFLKDFKISSTKSQFNPPSDDIQWPISLKILLLIPYLIYLLYLQFKPIFSPNNLSGDSACTAIAGQSLIKMLKNEIQTPEDIDSVLLEGIKKYNDIFPQVTKSRNELKETSSSYLEWSEIYNCPEYAKLHSYNNPEIPTEDLLLPYSFELEANTTLQEYYENILTTLQNIKREQNLDKIGAVLTTNTSSSYALTLEEKTIHFFDSHGLQSFWGAYKLQFENISSCATALSFLHVIRPCTNVNMFPVSLISESEHKPL